MIDDLTAVILCGGRGERLRPFTDNLPKALVPLNGRPLLLHLVEHLKLSGVRRFVFCTGYLSHVVENFLSEGLPPGLQVFIDNQGKDASMIARLRGAAQFVLGQALICYGDTVANVDINALIQTHQKSGSAATLTVHPLRCPFGLVRFSEDSLVKTFDEKPLLPYWINIGYILCKSRLLLKIDPAVEHMQDFLFRLANSGQLQAFQHTGKHLTVNTEKERSQAESDIVDMFTLQ
ncbi:MAG: nucleotidyltransferase family protein [Opitutae bacterium]